MSGAQKLCPWPPSLAAASTRHGKGRCSANVRIRPEADARQHARSAEEGLATLAKDAINDPAKIMSVLTVVVLQAFIAGPVGLIARTNIAAFLLTTESVDSARATRRLVYRYLVFSFHYMLSFMLTPLVLGPVLESLEVAPMEQGVESLLYAAACVPLALLFYYLDHRFMVWTDKRKLDGRERYRQKWES